MNEGKQLREAMDSAFGDALDDVMSRAFRGSASRDESPADAAGEFVGRYKLLEQIGEGGFGVVYMAEQQQPIRRRVALKIIKLGMDTKEVVARFEAERQALAMMDHENIASVFDAGATEMGRPYFVMELVRGIPITDYCDRNKLNTHQRLRLFVLVCKAVQHAHQKGIIHRDLKPTNVIVTLREGSPTPKVIDFGVAKATQARLTEKTIFTRHGQFIGTPAYMSPEQVEMSELDVDTRSDIYSLGVMLYELLTGSTPIEQEQLKRASYSEMQQMICQHDPPPPSSKISHSGDARELISTQRATEPKRLGQLLRGELDWIVMKSLEKDRTRRYETANGLAADIQRYLNNEPVAASPATATYKLRKFAHKHQRWVAVGLAFAVLLLASTVVSGWLAFRAMRAESKATYNEHLATRRLKQEKRQRDLADELSGKLQRQLEVTDAEVERSRHLLYVAHLNIMQQELRTGSDARIVDLLNLHRPRYDQPDLRGFEWYYVWGICHRNPSTWQHYAAVNSIAYSPDGKIAVSGDSAGTLRVWDAKTAQLRSTIRRHDANVIDVEFSADGSLVASVADDRMAMLWKFDDGNLTLKRNFGQQSAAITCVAFSPNSSYLAIGTEESAFGSLRLYDLASESDHIVHNVTATIRATAFSRDSDLLVSAGASSIVSIHDVSTTELNQSIESGIENITSLAYSPTDDTLVLGGTDGAVEFWTDFTRSRVVYRHSSAVHDLAYSHDGTTLASCGGDQLIVLWDARRQEPVDMLRGHAAEVHAVAFSPDATSLVSASADNTVKQWDLTHGQAAVRLASHNKAVSSVAFSPTNRNILASASGDGLVKVWNADSSHVQETLPEYDGPVHCVAFSHDGRHVAYGGGEFSEPARLFIYDRQAKTLKRTAAEHSRGVLAVAFSPDRRTVASADDDGVVILWNAATATSIAKLDHHMKAIVSIAFSADGRLLATSSFRQSDITLWNVATTEPEATLRGHRDWVTSLAFSPDGSLLASGGVDNSVRIWDVATGESRFELFGHSRRIASIAFSPDGKTLASMGKDNQLKLWHVATGQEMGTLFGRPDMDGASTAFSRDGRMLATASGDSVIVHRAVSDDDFRFQSPPATPQNVRPISGGVTDALPVVLEASSFEHAHPRVQHAASHWQVTTVAGDYSSPVLSRVVDDTSSRLSIEHGMLLPKTTYHWRVAFVGSNRQATSYSEESSFTTGEFPIAVVPFDLSPHFNRDVIKNPGDDTNDSIDISNGSHLVVEGYDGQRSDNPNVHGVPRDGQVGMHTLGDFNEKNAIQLGLYDRPNSSIRIAVPTDYYSIVRFLVVGGNGNSDVPVRFEFEDGQSQREVLLCDDWFHDIHDNRYGMLRPGLLPIINRMDRFDDGEFHNADEPAIFEAVFKVRSPERMTAIVLESDSGEMQFTDTALYPDHSRTRFNLLAVIGVKAPN